MKKILAKELKLKFIETLSVVDKFVYHENNPFYVKINNLEFILFLKNISPAYFKNKDITRVQLPFSEHFKGVLKMSIPFLILGYDVENDIVVSWNPSKVKERLNSKSNVSLYSRVSYQLGIEVDEFKIKKLSNGEAIMLFRRESLPKFLINFQKYYDFVNEEFLEEKKNEVGINGKLQELTSPEILKKINPLLETNQVLKAVQVTMDFYKNDYENMGFKDWFNLVKEVYVKYGN